MEQSKLDIIVAIIKTHSSTSEQGLLIIKDLVVEDIDILLYLDTRDCIQQIHRDSDLIDLDDLTKKDLVEIEFSLVHLNAIGFYETLDVFLNTNKTNCPSVFYINDIDVFNYDFSNENYYIVERYRAIISLIHSLKELSKYEDDDAGIMKLFILNEKSALVLSFIYDKDSIVGNNLVSSHIKEITAVLAGENSERKILYINEFVEFLSKKEESERFTYLLRNFEVFYLKCLNSYQFYLSNYSYNKLKHELDENTLNYSLKIQSVINDAQNKLIALPVVFVLAVTGIDFTKISSARNIITTISLFIFAVLLEIFLKNQFSSLNIIDRNIQRYKETFGEDKLLNAEVTSSFSVIDGELKKQKSRLKLIQVVNWGIPVAVVLFLIIAFALSELDWMSIVLYFLNMVL